MKPYGIPKRKKTMCCGPHDAFDCWCDNTHKKKERADARLAIKKELKELKELKDENLR